MADNTGANDVPFTSKKENPLNTSYYITTEMVVAGTMVNSHKRFGVFTDTVIKPAHEVVWAATEGRISTAGFRVLQ